MTARQPFRCHVMGSESLLVQCSEILLSEGHTILGVVTRSDDIARWAAERGLRVIAPDGELAAHLGAEPFDWLFSIANLALIADDVLALPRRGTINFHDAPLPRYAGLHAPTWAILHGERTHGVTWHRVEGGIDEGDVVEQQLFELDERETALTLNTRCYELGIDTFARLVGALGRGEERRVPQDLSQRTYFGRHDRPPAACAIDWSEPAHRIDALVRALDHGRYPNPIGVPKVVLADGALLLPEVERGSDTATEPPGTVLSFGPQGLEVATGTGSLVFPRVLDADGEALTPEEAAREGVAPGAVLSLSPERRALLGRIDGELARAEPFWTKRLAELEPARLPTVERAAGDAALARRPIALSGSPATIVATVAAWLARVTGQTRFDVGYRHPGIAERVRGAEALYAPVVPLRIDVDRHASFAALREAVQRGIDAIAAKGTYPRELVHRQPAARRPAWDLIVEHAATLEGYAPPTAALAAIAFDGARAVLVHDEACLRDVESACRTLEVLLAAAEREPATAVGALPLLSDDDRRRVVEDWNRTQLEHARDRCVHQLVEAQIDRTPDAVAIVHRETSLTYRELGRRASRLAHHLVALGVGPDTPVGLCTDRSADLVIGALAILEAGGAYVPLDPSYPAERLAFMLEDSRAPVIVTQRAHRAKLPSTTARVVTLDDDAAAIAARPEERPATDVRAENLAYLIYTSGSTGRPKGVMVEHRNVASFFAAMDERIEHDPPGTWLAVTSLSFDISVLELFWTLARGFRVVLASDEDRTTISGGTSPARSLDFSLFYFASDEGEHAADKYRLLLEGARFADEHGFSAVWTPERHFHAFGGLYPNPSVASAALAMITERVKLRAGSCVSPLHHPARVAEEWALVDNLSNGRVAISFAAGWQPNDFVLRPEAFEDNKKRMIDEIDLIRRLWRGESVELPGPKGPVAVRTLPRPVQPELPFFLTAAGNPETFALAGKLGGGILTHLLGQSLEEVATKIAVYRRARSEAGHAGDGQVVLMLHTFVGPDADAVKETVRGPMKAYLKSSMMLIQQHAWSFPAFKRHARDDRSFQDNFTSLSPEDTEALLDHAFERYYETSGLFGTPESCAELVEACRAAGVDEIGCLIDYGVDSATVMAHLPYLDALRQRVSASRAAAGGEHSLASQLVRHGVTHMQCTPSMARMLVTDDEARAALRGLSHLLIGGEAFPGSLAAELRRCTSARITNMYGPTETTIWSATHEVVPCDGTVPIGRPIANTRLYVLDEDREPLPVGVPGELYIAGDGVARGYWEREELTRERFVPDPFVPGSRAYRTGDLVRWAPDGTVEFLGRVDHQVKVRGHRIELGEIEARLAALEGVREAVVIAREDTPADARLVAYVIADRLDAAAAKARLREHLPEFMVPAQIVRLERFPLTPNKKIDRRALPAPSAAAGGGATRAEAGGEPRGELERIIATVWKRILGLNEVSLRDNFFELGGHSLLAVQAHREIKEATGKPLTVTDVFRFPTIAALAAHLGGGSEDETLQRGMERGAARRQAASGGSRRVLRRR